MHLNTLDALFEDTLRDMYYAEKKLARTLPKMAKKANSAELADAFNNHKSETDGHVERIEKIFQILGKTPQAKRCEAVEGIVSEGAQVMRESSKDGVRDVGLIASGQAVEHYEIARYGTLIAWADQMNLPDAVSLLGENLAEEKAADEMLSRIAETVNPTAERAAAA